MTAGKHRIDDAARADLARTGLSERVQASLLAYIEHRCPVGDFLSGVLANDLRKAVGHADQRSLACLAQLVTWLHWHCPSEAWGSAAKVTAWKARGAYAEEIG